MKTMQNYGTESLVETVSSFRKIRPTILPRKCPRPDKFS